MNSSQQHGFFIEAVEATGAAAESTNAKVQPRRPSKSNSNAQRHWLGLQADAAYLVANDSEPPVLLVEPAGAESERIVLAPVQYENQSFLVMLSPYGRAPRLNGQPAPQLALLRVRDQLQINDRFVLHVSLLNRPHLGRPREQEVGTDCPYCRVPFVADTTVYVCPICDKAMHCEGPEKPEEDRLECARLTTECRHCNQPVNMKEGFVYVPNI